MTLGRRQAALLAGSSALFFLVLYGLTVAPDVVGHDAGELQFVPYIFGIPHAPGYPLYLLVGKLWSLLPIGSVAFRMNLLSAVFGAAAVSLTAMCGLLLTGNTAAGLAAALAVGLAPLEWLWSGIAGIRSLTVAFVAATVLAALHWERRRSRPALVTLGLVCGFALDNHRTVIFLLPFLAAYVLLVDWQVLRKPAPLAGSALALLAPLLLYGVLWLRAATGSPWDQYDAGTWHGFLNVALGGADSAAHLDLPWQQALGRWRLLLAALPGAFSPLLLALALIGLIYLILRRRPEALLLGGYGLVMALFTLEWNVGSDLNLVYLMPAYVPVALLASSGIAWLCEAFRGRTAQTVGTLLLAAIAALAAYQDRGKLSPAPETLDDFRQQLFSGHQARRLASAFASLPPNATVVGDWDQATVFWYAQFVDRSNQTAAIVYPATKLQNAYGAAHGPVFLATSSVRPPTNVTVSAWGPLVQLGASPVAPPGPGICTFEGQIELAGIGPLPAPSYGVQPVTLQWRAVRRPDADYHVSVRLMPSPSVVATQRDEAAPVLGLSPTSTWQPGQVTADYYELDERGLPAGAYDLAVVLYQPLPNGGFRNLSCDGQERAIATRVNLPGSP